MALYTVTTGNTILAQDLNQVIGTLQRQSGQTESGIYRVSGNTHATNAVNSQWFASLSRTSSPVSVSIDTSVTSPVGLNSPTTSKLNSSGFLVSATGTGTTVTTRVGGAFTIQY